MTRNHNNPAPGANAKQNNDATNNTKPRKWATPRPTIPKHNDAAPDAEPRAWPNNVETDDIKNKTPIRQLNPNTEANIPAETSINTEHDPATRRQTRPTLNPDPNSRRDTA